MIVYLLRLRDAHALYKCTCLLISITFSDKFRRYLLIFSVPDHNHCLLFTFADLIMEVENGMLFMGLEISTQQVVDFSCVMAVTVFILCTRCCTSF